MNKFLVLIGFATLLVACGGQVDTPDPAPASSAGAGPDASAGARMTGEECCAATLVGDTRGDACCVAWQNEGYPKKTYAVASR